MRKKPINIRMDDSDWYRTSFVKTNLLEELNKKEITISEAKKEIYELSKRHITTRKGFLRRLRKINKRHKLFTNEELGRYTDWLLILKYEEDMDKLFSGLNNYSKDEIEYLCTKERIAFIDKVKVVKRLEG